MRHDFKLYKAPGVLILSVIIASVWFFTTPSGLLTAGNFFFGGGAYDINLAQNFLQKAILKNSGLAGAHYQLARVYFIKADFDKALFNINQEIALYPDFEKSYYVRGLIFGYRGDLDAAENDFKKFLSHKPKSWAGRNDLAWVYFKKGDFGAVEREARAGLETAPVNPWLLNSLGLALLNQNRNKEAEYYFAESKRQFEYLGPGGWGGAYPGNDPKIYQKGFEATLETIRRNGEAASRLPVDKPSGKAALPVVE